MISTLDRRDAFITAAILSDKFTDMPAIFESELRLMRIQECAESPILTNIRLTKTLDFSTFEQG